MNIAAIAFRFLSPFSSAIIAIFIGVTKEIHDYNDYGLFSIEDMAFNVAGVLFFIGFWSLSEFIKGRRIIIFGPSDDLFLFLVEKIVGLFKN